MAICPRKAHRGSTHGHTGSTMNKLKKYQRPIGFALAVSAASFAGLTAAAQPLAAVKAAYPAAASADLRAAEDTRIQQALEASLKKLALDRAVHEGRLAVALVDITDPVHPRMA